MAKKLEPLVWGEVKRIILDKGFAKKLLDEASEIYKNDSDLKEKENLKAKLHGFNSQIEALVQRISELPKTVSAGPFFKQLEKIEGLKNDTAEMLEAFKSRVFVQEKPVALKSYEAFLLSLKNFITDDLPPDVKTKLIQKLVHKVRVKPDGLEIEYFVGERYFERELVGHPTGSRSLFLLKNEDADVATGKSNKVLKLFNRECSNNLTFGARRGT